MPSDTLTRDQIDCSLKEHVVKNKILGIEALLNSEKGGDVAGAITLDNQVFYIAGLLSTIKDSTENDENDEGYSTRNKRKALAIAKEVLGCQGRLKSEEGRYIRTCQRELLLESQASLCQTTIHDHFKSKKNQFC